LLWNWNTDQLTTLSSSVLRTDSLEAINAVLLSHPSPTDRRRWEARTQKAKYLEAVEKSKEGDPIVLRALQRKYKQFSPWPIKEPNEF